jgi:pimeloyl-ACP methyl ester carboxylesterase
MPRATNKRRGKYVSWLTALGILAGLLGGGHLATERLVHEALEERPAEGRMVVVAGDTLHVIQRGDGPPMVLIHGVGGSLRVYTGRESLLPRLAEHFHVVGFDRPGHGHSPLPAEGPPGPKGQAALGRTLLDSLGVDEPVLLLAASWGASVAMAWALEAPEQVRGLLLIAPYIVPTDRPTDPVMALGQMGPVTDLVLETIAVPASIPIQPIMTRRAFHPQPVPEDYRKGDAILLSQRPVSLRAAAADLRSINPALQEMLPRYGSLPMPLILVQGEGDLLVPPGPNRDLADSLGWEAHFLPEMGHALHVLAPDTVAALARRLQRAVSR